jgi:hypothetical protein
VTDAAEIIAMLRDIQRRLIHIEEQLRPKPLTVDYFAEKKDSETR